MSPGHYAVLKVSSCRSLPLQDSMNFHSLEVVDRVSETQLQVGENSMLIIYRDGVSHKKHGTLNQCGLMLVHRLRRWPNMNPASTGPLFCASWGLGVLYLPLCEGGSIIIQHSVPFFMPRHSCGCFSPELLGIFNTLLEHIWIYIRIDISGCGIRLKSRLVCLRST